MASQNPSSARERPPYPPPYQAYSAQPPNTLPSNMQNLSISGGPTQTWQSAVAGSPYSGTGLSAQNPQNRPYGPPPFLPSASTPTLAATTPQVTARQSPLAMANSLSPMVRPMYPSSNAVPLSSASANGPAQMMAPGPPYAAMSSPYQQGSIPGRPPVSAAGTQVQSRAQSNAPISGTTYTPLTGPVYTGSAQSLMPPISSIGPPSAQTQVVGGPGLYPNAQLPWRPPPSQTAASGGYGFGLQAPPDTRPSLAPWPAASTYTGTPPVMRPQNTPGMPVQTGAPLQPPPMSQYLSQGLSQPGSPSTGSAAGSSRIDPTQIPRPQLSSTFTTFETRTNNQAALPPSGLSNFTVKDMGNCSPRYMRCTLNQIPCSGDLLANSSMPLALIVQPLALPHPLEEPIQVVDFGESGPVRCLKCKGYINPFMKFIDQGRHFKCNFCGQTNDIPRDYHCNLGPDNRRRDADVRPELSRGTVEFVATKEFLVRPPMCPMFFFLIDVSMNAVETGATAASCSAVQRALGELPNLPQVKVGIATFDSTLHFYNFNQAQQPSMLVVPDVQDVYAPLQSGLTVSIIEFREQLEQLLENIPSMFQNTRIADSALGAAIKGASLAMKSNGGKLLVFQSGLPATGYAALTARDSDSRKGPPPGEKDLNKLLQPVDKTLKTLAIELAELQVCCDLFLTTQEYVDVASLAVVPATTGGQVYYYHPFSATSDSAKLYNDLRWNLTRPQGLEAVMRVRCGQGLQVQEYVGNFNRGTPTDVDLPAIDCDKSVMVTFKHDEKLQDGSEICFQCALLYTTIDGQRRIRVTTLSLPCSTVLSNVFRGADLDAQFAYFLKHAAQEASTTPLGQLREKMTTMCVNILYTYRKFCATASSSGQLILPEALKLLPLFTLALTKSIGLRTDVRSDDRCYWLARALTISTSLAIPLVYPRMFAIHDLSNKEIGDGNLPPFLYLSSENLDNEAVFLLETGEDAFIYAGKGVSPETLFQLFSVQSVNEMQTNQFVPQEFDNDASRKLNALVNEIRKERCSYLRFRWCRRGDPVEYLFFSHLVEDKNALGLSYVEYLVHVHRQIQTKMT